MNTPDPNAPGHGERESDPHRQGGGHPAPDATILINLKQNPPPSEAKPAKKQRDRYDIVSLTLLALTFAAAVGAAIFTCFLWLATSDLVKGADKAAERQLRAYVFLELDGRPYPPPPETPNRFAISLTITNGGKTWARNLTLRSDKISRNDVRGGDPWTMAKWETDGPMVLGPGETFRLQFDEVPFADLKAIENKMKWFYYVVWVNYEDVISEPSVPRQTQLAQRLNADTEPPHGHISLGYLPTHNCADDDCPR